MYSKGQAFPTISDSFRVFRNFIVSMAFKSLILVETDLTENVYNAKKLVIFWWIIFNGCQIIVYSYRNICLFIKFVLFTEPLGPTHWTIVFKI